MDTGIRLIECLLIPKILYGCECWSNISKKQLSILEEIQKAQ